MTDSVIDSDHPPLETGRDCPRAIRKLRLHRHLPRLYCFGDNDSLFLANFD